MASTRYFIIDRSDRIPGNKKLRPVVITKAVNRKIGQQVFLHHGFLRVGESFMKKNIRAILDKFKSGLVEVRINSTRGPKVDLFHLELFLPNQLLVEEPEEEVAEVIPIAPKEVIVEEEEQEWEEESEEDPEEKESSEAIAHSDVWATNPKPNFSQLTKKELIEKVMEKTEDEHTESSLNRLNKDALIELLEG